VVRAARLLGEGRGFAGVETAFVSQAAPDVPAGLDRCRALAGAGEPGRIVVLPYFLLPGGPVERLHMQAEGWAAAHPGTEVFGATVIGPEAEVADVVMERYRAMVAGGASCGCRAAAEDARSAHGAQESASLAAGTGER
jgi:sirohydrochlorin cobaltochelatase